MLKQFVAAAEESTGLESTVDPRTATKGVKRTATLTYPTGSTSGALRSGVLLELGTRGGAMPTSQRQVASLIVEHWPGEEMGADSTRRRRGRSAGSLLTSAELAGRLRLAPTTP